jgi:hypothetical protein
MQGVNHKVLEEGRLIGLLVGLIERKVGVVFFCRLTTIEVDAELSSLNA